MRNFTKVGSSIFYGVFALCILLTPDLLAQSHNLVIDSPASIAGEYGVQMGQFGSSPCSADGISGELAFVTDAMGNSTACDTVTENLSGKIAVIDRGNCDFSIKAYYAQQAGAIAVIVCNNVTDPQYINMAAGQFAEDITIPSLFMLKSDCDIIKLAATGQTISGTLEISSVQDDIDSEIVFEEQFNGGLNGWESRAISCSGLSGNLPPLWEWVQSPEVLSNCFIDGTGAPVSSPVTVPLESSSKCNGLVVFHSEFLDSPDDCFGAGGTGICPAPHIGELISPEIDLSTSNASSYSVRFTQESYNLGSTYYVGWSFDGGVTWDSVQVNTDLGTPDIISLDRPDLQNISVPMIGSGDVSSVRVKFRFEGNYVFWMVDDVRIIAQEANNLRVNSNFYAIPPNAIQPLAQAEPIPFLADIENVGAATQTNVNLSMTIVDTNFQIIYEDDNFYGTVPGNTLVENIPFENEFTPSKEGLYIGAYNITADSADADEFNNTQGFLLFVSDTTFAKEFGPTRATRPADANWETPGEAHSWAYGNYFHVPNPGSFARSVTFDIGNPTEVAGRGVIINLYEWVDTNNDRFADPEERTSVDFTFYTVVGNEIPGRGITVAFDNPVPLKENTSYLVMLEYVANDQQNMLFVISEDLDYLAQIVTSEIVGRPRYASFVGVNGDLSTETYDWRGFGFDVVPVVRLNIGSTVVSTKELDDISTEFTVFPNPAKESINLQLGLRDVADNATVRLMDVSGKLIMQRNYDRIQKEIFQYSVKNLPAGAYFLQLTTDEGTGTRKFMVAGQ